MICNQETALKYFNREVLSFHENKCINNLHSMLLIDLEKNGLAVKLGNQRH